MSAGDATFLPISCSCDLWGEVADQPDSVAADLLDVGAYIQAFQLGVEDDGSGASAYDNSDDNNNNNADDGNDYNDNGDDTNEVGNDDLWDEGSVHVGDDDRAVLVGQEGDQAGHTVVKLGQEDRQTQWLL